MDKTDALAPSTASRRAAVCWRTLRRTWGAGSGPKVTRAFQILLAVIFLNAWLSLGVQIHQLIGSEGLLPVQHHLTQVDQRLEDQAECRTHHDDPAEATRVCGDLSRWDVPTLLWRAADDTTLTVGIMAGVALALCAFFGLFPRVSFGLSTVLYLSYAVACRDFLSFQWDNMLIESGMLAVFLSVKRPSRWIHFLFRILLFKLYFESGIAKWMSGTMDWHDGSAMTVYYETSPIPTWLGWYAHNLPEWWHHFESRAAMVLELAVPLFIFGPRVGRVVAFVLLTGFQLLDLTTANYGFFCYHALILHVFLLDDGDIQWLQDRLRRLVWWRRGAREKDATEPEPATPKEERIRWGAISRRVGVVCLVLVYLGLSAMEGVASFGLRQGTVVWNETEVHHWGKSALSYNWRLLFHHDAEAYRAYQALEPDERSWMDRALDSAPSVQEIRRRTRPLRLVNSYHLFATITTYRYEVEFQTFSGDEWTAQNLHYKPNDPSRAPPFVAPHQPRVDFSLWFYPLRVPEGAPTPNQRNAAQRGMPRYVRNIALALCHAPESVQGLFEEALPARPDLIRLVFWDHRMTTSDERRETGHWWNRTELFSIGPWPCERLGLPGFMVVDEPKG